jgi:glucosamine kinase
MMLIADSGSTKTEWRLVNGQTTIKTTFTQGINPFYQDSAQIAEMLQLEFPKPDAITRLYFYGAGCANAEKNKVVEDGLRNHFITDNISIASDLTGAARAMCQTSPGIACILGTGSNSCYYNGQSIVENVSPLGFILGDEGSGAVIGKTLIGNILKKQLPQHIIDRFFEHYPVSPADIIHHVYRLPFPNRYLAQYSKFVAQHIGDPQLEQMVLGCFDAFIERNVLQYANAQQYPIHFTGSVAFYFAKQLNISLAKHGLSCGTIVASPMDALVRYHIELLK